MREMTEKDLEQVIALEKLCFKDPWLEKECLYELNENPFSHGFVLEDEGEIVAYAFFWETFEIAQLARIGVNPEKRKKGYGSILMKEMMDHARENECEFISLDVRATNVAAQALYTKFGLIEVNRSKKYYADGEDAIVMSGAL
ncbi:MAG: ribosomal protein S18-alanine N-acetyltransferase [Firmicutes bacterium]|nr:ribosomal protein S18-alanine N-acetyltransferase [Bacillota bacterium]